jgi:spermidine synthase
MTRHEKQIDSLGAILREYLAIVAQELGLRAVARRLRVRSPRAATVRPIGTPPATRQIRGGDGDVPRSGDGATSEAIPLVVDTNEERQLLFTQNALQSRMRLDDPYALIAPYTRQMMSFLLFDPDPEHVLLVGLGGGSLAKFCYRHLPQARITVVEIDQRVIALRDSFHIPPDDHRFRIVHDDGTRYVAEPGEQVDAILIDAFDEEGVSPSLMTSEFFRGAVCRLTHTGVLIMNLHGDPDRFAAQLDHARIAFENRMLLAPVTGSGNVLLCAFAEDADPPAARQLFLRARHLQSKLRLNFRVYLQRMREAENGAGI